MHAYIQVAFPIPHFIPKSKNYGFFSPYILSPKTPWSIWKPFCFLSPLEILILKYVSLPISTDNSFDMKTRTDSSLQVYIC